MFISFQKKILLLLRFTPFFINFVKKLAILKSNNFIEMWKELKSPLNLDKKADKMICSMPMFEPIGNLSKFGSLNFPDFPDFGN